ncbi:MAG: hypothetical protein Q7U75_16750, partial [Desulfobacterales bacterium]|nr:hypothetical protein [Desulfobacterales bacterium]
MKLNIGKQESELVRAAQAAMNDAGTPADGIAEMADAPAPSMPTARPSATPPEDPRDVMEAMALRELGAPSVAAAAIVQAEDEGPDDDLDRIAAEIMSEEGLTLPRFPTNRVGDKEHCDEALTILGKTLHPSLGFEKFGYYQHDRAL